MIAEVGASTARERLPVSWFELFYDLVLVAALVSINSAFLDHPTAVNAATAASAAAALFGIWLLTTLIGNRFPADGMPQRLLLRGQVACSVVAALAVDQHEGLRNEYGLIAFGLALLLTAAALVWQERAWRAGSGLPARVDDRVVLIAIVVAALVAFVATDLTDTWRWVAIVTATAIAVSPAVARWPNARPPIEPRHLGERMGLFVLMVLGLSFGQLVMDLTGSDSIPDLRFFLLMFVLMFVLWWMYFGLELSEQPHRVGRPSWIAAHYLLLIGIVALGDVMSALSAARGAGELVDGAAYLGFALASSLAGFAMLVLAEDRLGSAAAVLLVGLAVVALTYDVVVDVTDSQDLRLTALVSAAFLVVAAIALGTLARRHGTRAAEMTSRNPRQSD
mgnify:CR=1 FL=1